MTTTTDLLPRAALTGAVLTSGLALADAVWQATADGPAPWTPGEGIEWVARIGDALHGVTFVLLAAALMHVGARIDAGRGAVRWLRRVLAVDLGLMGVAFCSSALVVTLGGEGLLGAIGGAAFLALFVLAIVLGVVMLSRRPTRHLPAWLMAAPIALIPLTVLADTVGWAHPGYAETAVYVGVGLLVTRIGARTAAPATEDRSALVLS
jgi:hypothetical protein